MANAEGPVMRIVACALPQQHAHFFSHACRVTHVADINRSCEGAEHTDTRSSTAHQDDACAYGTGCKWQSSNINAWTYFNSIDQLQQTRMTSVTPLRDARCAAGARRVHARKAAHALHEVAAISTSATCTAQQQLTQHVLVA